jgi:hypothetical protein
LHFSCLVFITYILRVVMMKSRQQLLHQLLLRPLMSLPNQIVVPRATRSSVKKVPQARYPKRSKKAKEPEVSLEAPASMVSSDDVSNSSLLSFPFVHFYSYTLLFSGFGEEIYCPGHGVCGIPKGCESFRRYNFDIQSLLFFCAFPAPNYLTSFRLLL